MKKITYIIIEDQELKNSYFFMRVQMVVASGLTVLIFLIKKYKLSIIFGIVFILLMLSNQ